MAGAVFVAGPSSAVPAPTVSDRAVADQGPPDGKAMQRSLQTAAAADDLRTPFEESNGATWTSLKQAQQFRRQLDASSERVSVQRVGRSGAGEPIQLISVGYPAPEPRAAAAKGSVVLFNCSIHGNEPSGREACLQVARDMASTQDPGWKRLLSDTTVLFININPDGWKANTRGNAEGIDINRDFLGLKTPEARALAKVMRDWKPDVLNDLHEFGPREYYDTQALVLWPRNRNVDPAIHRLSKRMVNDYTSAQIEAAGHTTGIYGVLVKDGKAFQQVAGDHQARILRNYTGLRHITGQLTETASRAVTPEEEQDATLVNRRRVHDQYASSVGSMSMVLERRAQLARQSAAAEERDTRAGAARSGVVYFSGQDTMLPTTSDGADPSPMCGYQLSRDQLQEVRSTLRLHDISWARNADGAYVTMAQPGRGLIPLLFDGRAEYGIATAEPVTTC
jgi:hypothetical protein